MPLAGCNSDNRKKQSKPLKSGPKEPVKKKDEKCPFKVIEIKAKVPSTSGKRDTSKKRADNILKSSKTNKESLTENPPVILVRGCKDVELEAITNPAGKSVKWQVKANENKSAAPTITPQASGKKAKIKTDKPGSFSVIATLNKSQVVWNVVFVWVRVFPKQTIVRKKHHLYADNGSTPTYTRFRSGKFQPKKYAWTARCKCVKLIGGGNKKDIGIDKVELHMLQNCVADTLTGHYDGGGTCLEKPKGGLPVVDASSAASPFAVTPGVWKVSPNNTAKKRATWMGDSPCGGFDKKHKNMPGKLLKTISGINGFVAAIASTSKQAPNAIVVHAKINWAANYKGKVNYPPPGTTGKYKRDGAKTTGAKRFVQISPKSGGKDACEAGFETFDPRFNSGVDEEWKP